MPDSDFDSSISLDSSIEFESLNLEKFKILSILGAGGDGIVVSVVDNETGIKSAIKVISFTGDCSREFREIESLSKLRNIFVVEMMEFCKDENGKGVKSLFKNFKTNLNKKYNEALIVLREKAKRKHSFLVYRMELLECNLSAWMDVQREGGLINLLLDQEEGSDNKKWKLIRVKMFLQMIRGLESVHSENIIHRDIKPANIFVDDRNRVKLGDFGSSTKHLSTVDSTHTSKQGTPEWWAPEQETSDTKYGFSVDIYSLGLVFGVIMFNVPSTQTYHFIRQIRYLRDISQPANQYIQSDLDTIKDIIKIMTDPIPEARISLANLKSKIQSYVAYIYQTS